jgi:hypothetical protein
VLVKLARNLAFAFLIIFLIITSGVIYLVKFDNGSDLGKILKRRFLHSPLLVGLVNLNEPGDYRDLYLLGEGPIVAAVYSDEKNQPGADFEIWVSEMIKVTTQRPVEITTKLLPSIASSYSNDRELNAIQKMISPRFDSDNKLNIVYLATYARQPSAVGVVLHKDTIFIFNKALEDLTENRDR